VVAQIGRVERRGNQVEPLRAGRSDDGRTVGQRPGGPQRAHGVHQPAGVAADLGDGLLSADQAFVTFDAAERYSRCGDDGVDDPLQVGCVAYATAAARHADLDQHVDVQSARGEITVQRLDVGDAVHQAVVVGAAFDQSGDDR